jgi:hypothetical protein
LQIKILQCNLKSYFIILYGAKLNLIDKFFFPIKSVPVWVWMCRARVCAVHDFKYRGSSLFRIYIPIFSAYNLMYNMSCSCIYTCSTYSFFRRRFWARRILLLRAGCFSSTLTSPQTIPLSRPNLLSPREFIIQI